MITAEELHRLQTLIRVGALLTGAQVHEYIELRDKLLPELIKLALQSLQPPADLAELARLRQDAARHKEFVRKVAGQIGQLEATEETLIKYATRYQWLRANWYYDVVVGYETIDGMRAELTNSVDGAEMDAAIDAQLNKDTQR